MKQSESFQMLSLKWQALLKARIANTFFLQFVALSWLPSTLRSLRVWSGRLDSGTEENKVYFYRVRSL